jgi:hypothetical protein
MIMTLPKSSKRETAETAVSQGPIHHLSDFEHNIIIIIYYYTLLQQHNLFLQHHQQQQQQKQEPELSQDFFVHITLLQTFKKKQY